MNLIAFKLKNLPFFIRRMWKFKPQSPPYKHIVQLGDPILRQISKPVDMNDLHSASLKELYSRLTTIMKKTEAFGVAAPQIGVPLRVFAIQCPAVKDFSAPLMYKHREMEPIPFQIWINPEMKILDYDKIVFDEECESMRGFSADVARYKRVQLTGLTPAGEAKSWRASGWSARIVQHEMDHLDGVVFTDVMNARSLCCSHWQQINEHEGRIYTTFMPGK